MTHETQQPELPFEQVESMPQGLNAQQFVEMHQHVAAPDYVPANIDEINGLIAAGEGIVGVSKDEYKLPSGETVPAKAVEEITNKLDAKSWDLEDASAKSLEQVVASTHFSELSDEQKQAVRTFKRDPQEPDVFALRRYRDYAGKRLSLSEQIRKSTEAHQAEEALQTSRMHGEQATRYAEKRHGKLESKLSSELERVSGEASARYKLEHLEALEGRITAKLAERPDLGDNARQMLEQNLRATLTAEIERGALAAGTPASLERAAHITAKGGPAVIDQLVAEETAAAAAEQKAKDDIAFRKRLHGDKYSELYDENDLRRPAEAPATSEPAVATKTDVSDKQVLPVPTAPVKKRRLKKILGKFSRSTYRPTARSVEEIVELLGTSAPKTPPAAEVVEIPAAPVQVESRAAQAGSRAKRRAERLNVAMGNIIENRRAEAEGREAVHTVLTKPAKRESFRRRRIAKTEAHYDAAWRAMAQNAKKRLADEEARRKTV